MSLNTSTMPEVTPELAVYSIAVIVPCYNEEAAIAKVVTDLRANLPTAIVYVYDNASTDATAEVARNAGAVVRSERSKGKGNVVRRAFADIDADIYVLIDGDDTYDPTAAPRLVEALIAGPYDHVLGVRQLEEAGSSAYRPAHELGNRVLNCIVGSIFGMNVGDMLSGYRAFSRRFVKSFPALSKEFEIETELTVHCLALRIPSESLQVGFRDRAEGTESKLRTYRDGSRILKLIVNLARHERPVAFYGLFAAMCMLASVLLSVPVLVAYLDTGLVPRIPTLMLSLALVGLGVVAMTAGLVLDGIRKARHEVSRLSYLTLPAVRTPRTWSAEAAHFPRQTYAARADVTLGRPIESHVRQYQTFEV